MYLGLVPTFIAGLAVSIVPHHHTHPVYVPVVIQQEAIRTNRCEEPTWSVNGSEYKGGLGWRPATWQAFKAKWMPSTMNLATPKEQMWAFWQFTKYYHFVPDTSSCHGY